MNIIEKLKETLSSVVPIMAIVLLLALTVVPFPLELTMRFLTRGLMVVFGLTLFLIGIDIGILPIGERSGAALTSKKNLKKMELTDYKDTCENCGRMERLVNYIWEPDEEDE